MASLTDYFNRIAYKPKYFIGDRVFGYWNKIPFIGTVGNDTDKIGGEDPRVSIHLDLPIKYEDKVYNILFVTHDDIKSYLKEIK